MPFYEKGDVRIPYEEAGSGFPLMIIPGGGLNATIAWNAKGAPFNPVEECKTRVSLHDCRLAQRLQRPVLRPARGRSALGGVRR